MPEAGYAVRPLPIRPIRPCPAARRHPRYAARVLGRTRPDPGARGGGAGTATAWTLPAPAGHPLRRPGLAAREPPTCASCCPSGTTRTFSASASPWKRRACCTSTTNAPAPAACSTPSPARCAANCRQRRRAGPRHGRRTRPRGGGRRHRDAGAAQGRARRAARGSPCLRISRPARTCWSCWSGFTACRGLSRCNRRRISSSTGANAAAPATPGKTSSNSMYYSTGPDTSRARERRVGTQDSGELAQRIARGIAASNRTSRHLLGRVTATCKPASRRRVRATTRLSSRRSTRFLPCFDSTTTTSSTPPSATRSNCARSRSCGSSPFATIPPVQVLQGARLAIESSEYLPTLNRMRGCCDDSVAVLGLPAARDAYLEAAATRYRPEDQAWSHPAVYWAGQGLRLALTSPRRRRAPAGRASRPPTGGAAARPCGQRRLAPVPEARQGPWTERPATGGGGAAYQAPARGERSLGGL
jgi:hypothetical protein